MKIALWALIRYTCLFLLESVVHLFVCLLLKIVLLFLTRKYSLKDKIKTDIVAAAKLDTGSLVQVFYLYLFLGQEKEILLLLASILVSY